MAAITTYKVTIRRWELGWKFHIDGICVTQIATLASAELMLRDYVAAVLDVSPQQVSQLLNPRLDRDQLYCRTRRAESTQDRVPSPIQPDEPSDQGVSPGGATDTDWHWG